MNKKSWIIFSVLIVGIFGVLIYFSSKDRIDVSAVDTQKIHPGSESSGGISDHASGKKDSKVILVEYADFQCPGCNATYPKLKKITEKYQDKIAFVFRNFPLTSIHPNALAAASAAEAAGLQGKYWQMNHLIFENNSSWSRSGISERTGIFVGFARQLSLDIKKFEADMASPAVSKKITFDIALGKKQGVSGTPTIFLNGQVLDDQTVNNLMQEDGAKLQTAIESAIKKHGGATDKN